LNLRGILALREERIHIARLVDVKRNRTHEGGSPLEGVRYADLLRRARTGELASQIAASRRLEWRDRYRRRLLAASAGLG
jgi:hypothetical protein